MSKGLNRCCMTSAVATANSSVETEGHSRTSDE